MDRKSVNLFGLLVLLAVSAPGCVPFAAAWANITGGDTIPAEYSLTKSRLLIFVDPADTVSMDPHAVRQLHKTISDIFLETGTNKRVVPYEDWQALQQSAKGYNKLSIREIGEKLGADQVLYIRVDRFVLEDEPNSPLFKGECVTRVKVISTETKRDVHLWPRDEKGKRMSATTDPAPKDGGKSAGDVAKELAVKMGDSLAKLFYEHKSLDK